MTLQRSGPTVIGTVTLEGANETLCASGAFLTGALSLERS